MSALQVDAVTVQRRAGQGRKRSAERCFQKLLPLPWDFNMHAPAEIQDCHPKPDQQGRFPGSPVCAIAFCPEHHRITASPSASPRRFIVRALRIACRCTVSWMPVASSMPPGHVLDWDETAQRAKSEPSAQRAARSTSRVGRLAAFGTRGRMQW